jgi:ankyrin repeat protein
LSHIEVLLKDKDPDSTDENEYTLLMIACKEGHLNVVKYLISKGANVNARAGREFETTPLILSIVNKHKENYKYLLQNKADSNLPRRFFLTNKQIIEVTPLEEAINVKDEDAVRELLQAGASPKDLLTLSEKSGNKNIHKMIKKAGGTSKNE